MTAKEMKVAAHKQDKYHVHFDFTPMEFKVFYTQLCLEQRKICADEIGGQYEQEKILNAPMQKL